MSLYSRLEHYLEEHSDDAGPVRGTLSLPRIGMIWLAANLVVTTLLTGTLFVPGVDYGLVVVLIIVGVLLYLVETQIPMAPPIKVIIRVVVILVVVLWLLQLFIGDIPLPRVR